MVHTLQNFTTNLKRNKEISFKWLNVLKRLKLLPKKLDLELPPTLVTLVPAPVAPQVLVGVPSEPWPHPPPVEVAEEFELGDLTSLIFSFTLIFP